MEKCKYFGKCGGCKYQDIEYKEQLEKKKKEIQELLGIKEIKVFSGEPFFYRNRMDFAVSEKGIGLKEKGNWDKVINIDECLISNKKINELIKQTKKSVDKIKPFDERTKQGTLKNIVIRAPRYSSSVSFVLNKDSEELEKAEGEIKKLAEEISAENILITYVPRKSPVSISEEFKIIKGNGKLKEKFLGKTFYFSAQGFFQTNSALTEEMHKYVNSLLKKYETKNKTLIDLYSGVGCFGIINSELFKEVLILENFPDCVKYAEENIKENKIKNAKIVELDAKELKELKFDENSIIITDPPRKGMHKKTINEIKKRVPELIIYVSCNPKKFSEELKEFNEYELKSIALFDFFPHTPHIEIVAELVKKME